MEPRKTKPTTVAVANVDSFFSSSPGDGEEGQTLESHLMRQLIAEFRQLKLEVTALKAADQRVEEVKKEEGGFRYQLYYRWGYVGHARSILASGLTVYLTRQGPEWQEKECAFSIVKNDSSEGGWGAVRLDVAANSVSGLITLRKIMKAQLEGWTSLNQRVRTRKPTTESGLYSVEAEAEWRGRLSDAAEQIRGEGANF